MRASRASCSGPAKSAPPAQEVESKRVTAVEATNREAAAVQSEIHSIRDMVSQILVQQRHSGQAASKYFAARLTAPAAAYTVSLVAVSLKRISSATGA